MKSLHKSAAFLLSLILLLGAFSPLAASAASVPTISCVTDGMTVRKDSSEDLIFTITRAFPSEKYTIKVYAPSGLEVAYASGDVDAETQVVDLTIPVDSARLNLKPGKYTVKFYLSYYTNSKWNNTAAATASFQVLETVCKSSHSYGEVTAIQAPTCSTVGMGKSTCSVCGYVRFSELSLKHVYTDAADQKCNLCGHTRQAPTLIKENGIWKYYDDGFFTKATTLVNYNGGWFYVVDGILAHTYNGLVKYNGAWYYMRNGKLDSSATTLVKHNGAWYYVRKGKMDSSATTLVKYNGEWWYVVNGKVASNTTSMVKYNGEWWYVVKGKIASNTTKLVNHWGGWYYILKGKLAAKTTTLVKNNGIWYYVENGKVDFSYNGTFYYCYKNYTIVNGRVV